MLSAAGVTIDSIGGVWLCLLACCWLLWCFICAMLFGLVDCWFGVMDSVGGCRGCLPLVFGCVWCFVCWLVSKLLFHWFGG